MGDPADLSAVDVGCGIGATDQHLVGRFRKVIGVDIVAGVLERAAVEVPQAEFRHYDGDVLPVADATVDVVCAICVMHHVPPARWGAFATEMRRVLRPGGVAAIFEHNPLNPLTRRVVANCVFDEEAILLRRHTAAALLSDAGLRAPEHRYIAFLPFGGAKVAPVEAALRRVPLGAQYFVAAVR